MDNRYFYIKDVDCTITIEYATRKEMLEMIDEYVENCKTRDNMIANNNPNACYYDMSQDSFAILYKDGTVDIIDETFDGHHVKRQNIVSITNENPSTTIVFGHFGLNECGVAEPTDSDKIDESIKEVDTETNITDKETSSDDNSETSSDSADDNSETSSDSADDNSETSTDTNNETTTDNEVCTITPYENGKELTAPIPKMKCLANVIDYVTRLYDMNVVTRETYFVISRVGKRDVVLTYTNTHIEKLSHLIDNIRFNTKKYRDKYFDCGDTK